MIEFNQNLLDEKVARNDIVAINMHALLLLKEII
jgi:hypothetical protein